MNKEEFVTFEQAIALKYLGFDKKCLYHFEQGNIIPNGDLYKISGHPDIDVEDFYTSYNTSHNTQYNTIDSSDQHIDAPTIYQVKDWFSKKYNRIIDIRYDINSRKYSYRIIKNGTNVIAKSLSAFSSDTHALSVAISRCFELMLNI